MPRLWHQGACRAATRGALFDAKRRAARLGLSCRKVLALVAISERPAPRADGLFAWPQGVRVTRHRPGAGFPSARPLAPKRGRGRQFAASAGGSSMPAVGAGRCGRRVSPEARELPRVFGLLHPHLKRGEGGTGCDRPRENLGCFPEVRRGARSISGARRIFVLLVAWPFAGARCWANSLALWGFRRTCANL
ncbi:unnamed protein product [Amoebophrya sp. A120]|nr:unnamed protein product [Amoebophrya sp. A120]|eukprot:GSA120T00019878001.1